MHVSVPWMLITRYRCPPYQLYSWNIHYKCWAESDIYNITKEEKKEEWGGGGGEEEKKKKKKKKQEEQEEGGGLGLGYVMTPGRKRKKKKEEEEDWIWVV